MNKKLLRGQVILVLIGLIIIFITYFYNPYKKETKLVEETPLVGETRKKLDEGEDTSFENIEYKGFYNLDKSFVVKSKKAHVSEKDPNILYMTEMHVILYLTDGRVVNIKSTKGIYNRANYDCFFQENVRASDGETKIFAKNLDLLATENSVKIYNDVVLNNPNGSLTADKIDYDFETKHFKVSMFDEKAIKMKLIQ